MTTSFGISTTDIAAEASEHLAHLLAFASSSVPSWEFAATGYLLGMFEREGIPTLILPPAPVGSNAISPFRPNLVAHVPGSADREPLLLLSHLDNNPHRPNLWDTPSCLRGDTITGPGALSGMHLALAQAMALILLARKDVPLKRTIRFAATSEGAGGKAIGLNTLVTDHPEHISSDIALSWGSISWKGADGKIRSLLSDADKGALVLKLRAEGGGGSIGMKVSADPVEKLIGVLNNLKDMKFPITRSRASDDLVRSIASTLPESKSGMLLGLTDKSRIESALREIELDTELDNGIKTLLKACVTTELSIMKFDAPSSDGFRPQNATAELVYCYPPGEDVERLAVSVLESLDSEGVYLAEKSVMRPSENEPSREAVSMIRAALNDAQPGSQLITGLAPWPTGLGCLRSFGTNVLGWEPFASAGSLENTISKRGTIGESLEIGLLVREIHAFYSFLFRASR
ncbi:MAG: hypothetical protein ABIC40_03575 [bacterium]